MKTFFKTAVIFYLLLTATSIYAKEYDIIVDNNGTGDFISINDAINSLPEQNFERINILIKNGIYREKVLINRNFISLIGEDKTSTKIQFNQTKKEWLAQKDAFGAAVINIISDDIIIENLTINNTIEKVGPTAYSIYGTGTRTIINNCDILNNGANTVCLMNSENGMYYLKDSKIQGAVDMLRAMGWCYVENCSFYQWEAIASIWHAGINNPNQKMVVKNSKFDGVEHYFIGRHHFDAQFFIINCDFTKRLANKDLYQKTYKDPKNDSPYIFGDRHYYYGNKQSGTDYSWLKNNLADYNKKLIDTDINIDFAFDNKWNPERSVNIELNRAYTKDNNVYLEFNQPLTVKGELKFITKDGTELSFHKGSGRYILIFRNSNKELKLKKIELSISSGKIIPCLASLNSETNTNFKAKK